MVSRQREAVPPRASPRLPDHRLYGRGLFSSDGHYILIIGIDAYDRLIVVDPNSERKSQGSYPSDIIVREASSKGSFMVCYLPGTTPLALVED